MIKYFLKPLDCIDVAVIVLIILWFLLFTFNKYKRVQLSIFLISHTLFYIPKIILNRGNFFVPSLTVLLVSFIAFSIRYIINRKKSEKFFEIKWVYCFLSVALILFLIFGCILTEASSVLMPPQH